MDKIAEAVAIAGDNDVKIREPSRGMNVDYGLLVGGAEIVAASKDLGNLAGVLQFAVILGRTIQAASPREGALSEAALDAVLARLP